MGSSRLPPGRQPSDSWKAAYLSISSTPVASPPTALAQRANQLAPDRSTIADTIGWVLFRKGMYQTASKHLEAAVAQTGLEPEDAARRRYHLAMTYLKLGDRQRGTHMLDSALKLGPSLPEAREAKQMLAEAAQSK